MSEDNYHEIERESHEEEKVVELGLIKRIKYIFSNPVAVMEDINRKPQILIPLIIICITYFILLALRLNLFREFTAEQIRLSLISSGQRIEPTEQMIQAAFISGLVGVAIAPLLITFFKSFITHGIIQLMDGKGKFKKTFSVIIFSYFINVFGEIIRTIIGLLTGRYMITTSMAVFLPDSAINTPLFNLLSGLDVFSIWYLIVSIVGIGIIHKLSKGKASIAVLLPWIIMLGFSTISAMLRG